MHADVKKSKTAERVKVSMMVRDHRSTVPKARGEKIKMEMKIP